MDKDEKKLYSLVEVAEILDISRQAVWARVKRGTAVAERVGNAFVISREELKKLIKN